MSKRKSKTKTKTASRPFKKSKFTDIKEGDYMCEVQYYKVQDKDDQKIEVMNERKFEFGINDKIFSFNSITSMREIIFFALV